MSDLSPQNTTEGKNKTGLSMVRIKSRQTFRNCESPLYSVFGLITVFFNIVETEPDICDSDSHLTLSGMK